MIALATNATRAWIEQCAAILATGEVVSPRGQRTRELRTSTVHVDMSWPLVVCPARKLSYSFAAAEALWILAGDNRVGTIAPYAPNIARFSDDGVIFNGAYGPRIRAQLDFVLARLREDRDTRQAVLTIWQPNPPASKDTPCTVAMAFSIRRDALHCAVFMRSSDVWLGLPYDIFNFSMIAAYIACSYNSVMTSHVDLGTLTVTAASSHAYERDWTRIKECITDPSRLRCQRLPRELVLSADWPAIEAALTACRDNGADQATQAWIIRSSIERLA